MPEKKASQAANDKPAAVYFKSLTIRDVKCFKGEHTIDLSDGEGRPAQWTVILGNNNTGKTTILKCLAGLEAIEYHRTAIDKYDYSPRSLPEWQIFTSQSQYNLVEFSQINSSLWVSSNLGHDMQKENFFVHRNWNYGANFRGIIKHEKEYLKSLIVETYGASRRIGPTTIVEDTPRTRHINLYFNTDLFNAEDWLLQCYLAKLQGSESADKVIDKCQEVITSGLLPDVKNLRLNSKEQGQSFDNFIEFQTDFGWIRLRDLGYGYQTMLAWVLDLVRRMFERYPGSPNPIKEPAIVLVDEIDLHLHPEWQRKIITHLTKYFPNTQFIVTAHSPLVVQSAEKINLVLLEKDGDHVNIKQPKIPSYQGWSLEEILTELMGLGERTHSEKYLELIKQFEAALDEDNHGKAQNAYDELDKILHPTSHMRKLLRLQMSSLMPA